MSKNKRISVLEVIPLTVTLLMSPLVVTNTMGSKTVDHKVASEQLLENGNFEYKPAQLPPKFWDVKNREMGKFRVEKRQDQKDGHAFYVRLQKYSDYDKAFLLSQLIDVAALRGKVVSFGGDVKISNARVYLRLWTPEGHSQIEVNNALAYRHFEKGFKVPENASLLAFAMEVVGERGGEAWVDNLYVSKPVRRLTDKSGVNIITVDVSKKMGKINPLKFGCHLEWINAGHKLWDVRKASLNKQAVDLLTPLRIPVWRFPGGIYSDYYNWRDGITKPDRRPYGIDPFDQKTRHQHHFGTDEFIKLMRQTGSEALITANYGTGNLEMAVSWLKYFKSKGIKARYWEIGNEIYMADPDDPKPANGARIFHTARQYTEDFVRWADALKAVDHDIVVGAIGGLNNTHSRNRGWMDTLLKGAGHKIDFIALHNSYAPIILGKFDYTSEKNRLKAYKAMLAQVEYVKADVAAVKNKIRQYLPKKANAIRIAITEHFPIFGIDSGQGGRKQLLENLDQSRTMAAALYTGTVLTAIVNDPAIFMAHYLNPTHRYYGAFLNESSEGITRNPVYYVYYMYRNYFGDELVFSKFEGTTFSTPSLGMVPAISNAPILEVAAAMKSDGTITIAVVNKDLKDQQSATINLLGGRKAVETKIYILSSLWPNATTASPLSKSTRRQRKMKIDQDTIRLAQEQVVTFPPHSFNILELKTAAE